MFSNFSKGRLILVAVILGITGWSWWMSQRAHNRVALLAKTEARLRETVKNLSRQEDALTGAVYRLKTVSDLRAEFREQRAEAKKLREQVEWLEEEARADSPLKWAESAMVDLEEFFLPTSEADHFFEKFPNESDEPKLREALLARENGLVFRRRFAAAIFPDTSRPAYDDRLNSLTTFNDLRPGLAKGANYQLNNNARVMASELERLFVHTSLQGDGTSSAVEVSLNQGGGLILGAWLISREARLSPDLPPLYRVRFQTRAPVTPGKFQLLGSSDFRVVKLRGEKVSAVNGVFIAFARVTTETEKEAAP